MTEPVTAKEIEGTYLFIGEAFYDDALGEEGPWVTPKDEKRAIDDLRERGYSVVDEDLGLYTAESELFQKEGHKGVADHINRVGLQAAWRAWLKWHEEA